MRDFAGFCNNNLLTYIKIVYYFLFKLENIYDIYFRKVILRISACLTLTLTTNKT